MDTLIIALFLVVVANRLVEALVVPVFDKFKVDKFAVQYIAWAVGSVLVWLSGVNLFGAYLLDPLVGQIFTAAVAGGGATLLHDIFDGGGDTTVYGAGTTVYGPEVTSGGFPARPFIRAVADDPPCCEADDAHWPHKE